MQGNETIQIMFAAVASVSFFSMLVFGFVKWRQSKLKSELQKKLIERFSSGSELSEFMTSANGREYLKSLSVGGAGGGDWRLKLIGAVWAGTILVFLGIASFFMSRLFQESERILVAICIFCLALAAGFFAAAAVSLVLGRRWGIFDNRQGPDNPK